MVDNFYQDLEQARKAEYIVRDVLASRYTDYTFEFVGDQREYFHKGDIKAIDKAHGKEIMIEVKDDSRIADTHNVLCEDEVYYKEADYYAKGNMYSQYECYAVVSQREQKIYLIDFSILKEKYKRGIYKEIPHASQITYAYLVSLAQLHSWGALKDIISY